MINNGNNTPLPTGSILFVDDNSMILNALERTFFETGFSTFFARNAENGYTILKEHTIDMIVSDIRMLPVSGFDFLTAVRAEHPATIRLVLSAFSDREMMVRTIHEGLAQVYLLKPWDNQKLIAYISRLFMLRTTIDGNPVLQPLINGSFFPGSRDLHTWTATARAVQQQRTKEIATLLGDDPAYALNLLRIANSAFHGIDIESTREALVYLSINSFSDLSSITAAITPSPQLDTNQEHIMLLNHMRFCLRSVHFLHEHLFARRIAEKHLLVPLFAFIGRLFTLINHPDLYHQIISRYQQNPLMHLTEIEKEICGITHSELTGILLAWFNLPDHVVAACSSTYVASTDFTEISREFLALVYIADCFAWRCVDKFKTVTIAPDACQLLNTDEKTLHALITTMSTI